MTASDAVRRVFTFPAVLLIRCYQIVLSPLKGRPTCRFYPTCSFYAVRAYKEWGLIGGTVLSLYRILRCQPFCKGGFDPVYPGFGRPRRKKRSDFVKKSDRAVFLPSDGEKRFPVPSSKRKERTHKA